MRRALAPAAALVLWLLAGRLAAHDLRPAYLDLDEVERGRFAVLWRTPVIAEQALPVRLVLPDGCRVDERSSQRDDTGFDVERLVLTVGGGGITGQRVEFAGLERTVTDVLVRVARRDGRSVMALVRPTQPWLVVPDLLGPLAIARTYVGYGFEHIMLGVDHLLFVFGLLLLVASPRMLVKTITAFTVAHSLTLIVATLGWASAPAEPLNVAIALSILFIGIEVARTWRGRHSLSTRHPWVVAFLFGLLHGFGFASGLTLTGIPRGDLVPALLCFNVGVEAGQLLFVGVVLALGWAFQVLEFRWSTRTRRIPGYAIGIAGAFWTIQRLAMMCGWS